jgi:ABC-type uncharacterized transport system ATPase subunit
MSALVEMKDIFKVYPNGVVANRDVNFSVQKGQIHALVGENGAGKSTLMKILYGLEMPTSGQIFLNSKPVRIQSPYQAIDLGIGDGPPEFYAGTFFFYCPECCVGA